MNPLSRIQPEKLYPPFLSALKALLADAAAVGVNYWAVSGYRTYNDQTALWAQGRTVPGLIVTRAKGGESPHNFGLAVDLARDSNMERAGLQPDYQPESYELLRTLAPLHGLVWGGIWTHPDLPHVQMANYVTAAQLEPLRFAYEKGGLLSVFGYLDNAVCEPRQPRSSP